MCIADVLILTNGGAAVDHVHNNWKGVHIHHALTLIAHALHGLTHSFEASCIRFGLGELQGMDAVRSTRFIGLRPSLNGGDKRDKKERKENGITHGHWIGWMRVRDGFTHFWQAWFHFCPRKTPRPNGPRGFLQKFIKNYTPLCIMAWHSP